MFPEVRPKQIKKNWAKIEYQNRLDRPTADQLAQNNNPRMRQNRILRIDWTGANFSSHFHKKPCAKDLSKEQTGQSQGGAK